MRALLINSSGIQEISFDGSLREMYKFIGCRLVTGAGYPDDNHACWADDEGLFNADETDLRKVTWMESPLVGNLMITGIDRKGNTVEATMTVEKLQSLITFTTKVIPSEFI